MGGSSSTVVPLDESKIKEFYNGLTRNEIYLLKYAPISQLTPDERVKYDELKKREQKLQPTNGGRHKSKRKSKHKSRRKSKRKSRQEINFYRALLFINEVVIA